MTSRTAMAASLAEAAAAAARAEAEIRAAGAAAAAAAKKASAASAAAAVDAELLSSAGIDVPPSSSQASGSGSAPTATATAATTAATTSALPSAQAASSSVAGAAQPPVKKKHPNQWTYRKKDPNKPHPNQYTYRPKNGQPAVSRPPPKKRSKISRLGRTALADLEQSIDDVLLASGDEPSRAGHDGESSSAWRGGGRSSSPMSVDVLARHAATASGSSGSGAATHSHDSAASAEAAAAKARAEARLKEKRERERERKRKAKEEEEAAAAAEEEAEMLLDDKLYCICKTLYDEERMMIACDHCDEWYHTQCMGMSDAKAELVDMFVCPACEPLTNDRTTYKAKCLYTSCTHAALRPLSQFCSERCGILHAGAKIARGRYGRSNNLAAALGSDPTLRPSMFGGGGVEKLLYSREVQSGKKREGMVVWADGAEDDLPGWGAEGTSRDPDGLLHSQLADLRQRRAGVLRSQELTRARLKLVAHAVRRADTIPSARPGEASGLDAADSPGASGSASAGQSSAANGSGNGGTSSARGGTPTPQSDPLYRNRNKKRKGAGEVIEALVKNSWMRCGFDERLVWADVRFSDWMRSARGQDMLKGKVELDGLVLEDGLDCLGNASSVVNASAAPDAVIPAICGLAKRKCKRHVEWAAIQETALNTELEEQANLLRRLDEEEAYIKSRLARLEERTRAANIIASASDAALANALLRAARRPP